MYNIVLLLLSFFFSPSRPHPEPPSFPTRRSSDLRAGRSGPPAPVRKSPSVPAPRRESPAASSHGGHSKMLRSEEQTSELQSRRNLECRFLLEKKKKIQQNT